MTPIAPHIEAFLREHLPQHRGASAHTCDSYAYSFQLLFEFAAKRLKVAPSMVKLEQLDASLISAFLEHLETSRQNSAETRNIRLAAIRSFLRFLLALPQSLPLSSLLLLLARTSEPHQHFIKNYIK